MSAGIKANVDGSAAIQVGGSDAITLTSGGAAAFLTSPTTVQAGTVSAPSITFSGDTNTGIYSPGADQVTLVTGGAAAITISSGQRSTFPTTIGVGAATPSTSGAGITFPATQSASSDANTLDDYEEGTFTPTISAATPPSGISYTNQSGRYTKIGNVVYVSLRLTFGFTNGTGSGSVVINGLPFTSANTQQPKAPPQQDNITFTGFTYLEIGANQNTTGVGMGKNRSGGLANSVQISDCSSSNTDINTGFYYFV